MDTGTCLKLQDFFPHKRLAKRPPAYPRSPPAVLREDCNSIKLKGSRRSTTTRVARHFFLLIDCLRSAAAEMDRIKSEHAKRDAKIAADRASEELRVEIQALRLKFSNDAAGAQREAVRIFPELGKQGSEFNAAFVDFYERSKKLEPQLLRDGAWPLIIAERVAKWLDAKR